MQKPLFKPSLNLYCATLSILNITASKAVSTFPLLWFNINN